MAGPAQPTPDRTAHLVQRLAAGLLLALYAVLVSRGEFLPLPETLRPLVAPLLALAAGGLLIWRWRHWRTSPLLGTARRYGLPLLALLVGAAALRLALVRLDRPVSAAELAVLQVALQVINNDPISAPLPVAALGWLHAPLAALRYVAGVSGGLWQFVRNVTPEHLLAWSRLLHLLLSLTTVAGVAAGGQWLGGARAGWLAALALAVAGPSLASSLTIDWGMPLATLTTLLALLIIGSRRRARPTRAWPRWSLPVSGGLGLLLLWLPEPAVALAPLGALLVGWVIATWWTPRRA